ncbi:MAG: tetratricopeptide repeat protein [Acidobacteriota bacterium]
MSQRARAWLSRILASLLLLVATGCEPGPSPTPWSLVDLGPVSLEAMEPQVRQRLHDARSEVEALRQAQPIDSAGLGEAYGELGRLYQAYELPQHAIACYRNAHQLLPKTFRWPYLLGYQLYLEGDLAHAGEALAAALELSPGNPPAHLWAGHTALGQGSLADAAAHFERAIASDATCAGARFGLGEVAQEAGRLEDAVAHYREILARQPSASRVHYALARALRSNGNEAKAAEHFEQAASQKTTRGGWASCRDPELEAVKALADSSAAALLRASEAGLSGSAADEIAELRKAVMHNGDDAEARHALASALWQAGDVSGAMSHFERALELRPDDATLNYDFGFVLAKTNDLQRAEQHLQRALELHPDYLEAHLMLGTLYQRHGHPEPALVHYDRVLARSPHQLSARLQRALTLAELDRRPEAVAELRRLATESPPSIPQDKFNLASALGMLGETEHSAELLGKLARAPGVQPKLRARAHFNLGMIALGQQAPRQAREHFLAARRLDPDLEQAARGLREADRRSSIDESELVADDRELSTP